MCAICKEVIDRYNAAYDGETQGCCPVIADEIAEKTGGEVVAGCLCWTTVRRTHWWVETPDGEIHDPMGEELSGEPGFHRHEIHRDKAEFLNILPRYEQWRVSG